MSSEWVSTTIGEQLTLQRGFDITKATQQPGNVPVISSGGINSFHSTAMVAGPGVVLGRKGVVGSVYFVREDYWPHDTTLWIKNFHGNDEQFAYYFFLAKVRELEKLDVGSANPTLNRNHVHPMKVLWPPLGEQKRIGEILGLLDDRIALLRRTNATLEAIAQAMFKSWFVDFDPVRAKQEGRVPDGVDEATAALFPGSFDESELGQVPRGWRVQSLDETATYLNGLALQKFPPTETSWLPVIKIAQLRKGDTVGADRAGRTIKPEYIVRDGDVLFSWSGSLEVAIWCGGEGALNQHLFKVTSDRFPKWFYYLWTKHHLENFRQIAASKATTMGHIQRGHLNEAKVIVPPDEVIRVSDELFGPLLERSISTILKAQNLAALRDTLLPRLISGQLRLQEADKTLKEAA